MPLLLSISELHNVFLSSLGDHALRHSNIDEKPLVLRLKPWPEMDFEIYLYNCTNPPGARQASEYKSQLILPGQKRGERGRFVDKPNTILLLVGFATMLDEIDSGAFVLWDVNKHREFAYSANVQVGLAMLLRSFSEPVFCQMKRGNGEWIVIARQTHLMEGIEKRIAIDRKLLLGEDITPHAAIRF